MVLRCRQQVWSHIDIQQQNTRFEKPSCFFQITFSIFDRVPQYSVALMVQPPRKSKRLFRMQSPEFPLGIFKAFMKGFDKCLNILRTYEENKAMSYP
ncbi:hypothetical protein TNCV_2938781 [Trichonephila clavipes]|nr:hypothetical protein TNCV_2938781 [Trichonephila clavipes]